MNIAKIWTKMDNPFKRYYFSGVFIKFCEILMSPSQVGNCTMSWVHNSPLVMYTEIFKNTISHVSNKFPLLSLIHVSVWGKYANLYAFWNEF